jgi:hypothetical protein
MTMPSEPMTLAVAEEVPVAEEGEAAEVAFVEEAAGNEDPPTPIKGVRRLLWWMIPANLAIFIIWG